jgi:[protein-PII] uridylyltransferase
VDKKLDSPVVRQRVADILYPLWDKRLDIGHSVRTVAQTLKDAVDDFKLFTALLDARLLWGSQGNFRALQQAFALKVIARHKRQFWTKLLEHNAARYAKFGDIPYVLEPQIKEGHGGLRDFQSILWTGKALFGAQNLPDLEEQGLLTGRDLQALEQAVDFLIHVRFHLHRLNQRKVDRLLFEHQEQVARALEFQGERPEKAIEQFLHVFSRQVLTIKTQHEAFLDLAREHLFGSSKPGKSTLINGSFHRQAGRVCFSQPREMWQRPACLIEIFEQLAILDTPLSPTARQQVREALEGISAARETEEAKASFRRLLTQPNGHRGLIAMLETGVLERLIPEFQQIQGRIQFGAYHVHTVDYHSILTVRCLSELSKSEMEIMRHVSSPELLLWLGLLHDLGKGFGDPHADVGGPIAEEICRRFGLSREQAAKIRQLVQLHALMLKTATRRDLSEESVILRFAARVEDLETLSMLYLLTIADAQATGPCGWSSWKADLTRELYGKTCKILDQGQRQTPHVFDQAKERWLALRRIARANRSENQLPALEDIIPAAYLLAHEPEVILKHWALAQTRRSSTDVALEIHSRGDGFEVLVMCQDRLGLLSRITGVFSLYHFKLRTIKVFTWSNQLAVDVFEVVPPWEEYEDWDRLSADLRRAIAGKLALAARLAEAKTPLGSPKKPPSFRKPLITLDNLSSDFFTILEICAPEQTSCVFKIAKTITDFDLSISRAMITNKGDLADNIFYISTGDGEKIRDPQLEREIVRALEFSLELTNKAAL